jgi:drug/metabolite transporter (DMT)-like permease
MRQLERPILRHVVRPFRSRRRRQWQQWRQSKSRLLGVAAITLVALAYGSTYTIVEQLPQLPVGIINLGQFGIAALCFTPWLTRQRLAWRAGLELGALIGLYYTLQILMLKHYQVTESAFVMNLDILFVPLLVGFTGSRPKPLLWMASSLAFIGMVTMVYDGQPLNWHHSLGVLAALVYSIYLLRSDYWAQWVPSLTLTATKTWSGAILSLLWVALFERDALNPALIGQLPWVPLIYLGAIATGLTTFLQFWGQSRIDPTQTAIVLAMEPIWASLFAFILLSEVPTLNACAGAVMILGATGLSIVADMQPMTQNYSETIGN